MKKLLSSFLFIGALSAACILHAQVAPSIEWQRSLGGSGFDIARSILQTSDGGYIVAGYSNSTDGDISGNHGQDDYWIVKLDISGDIVWQKSLGGSGGDKAYCVRESRDGGFIIAGSSFSNDGDVSGNNGITDYWIVKLDAVGNLLWQKSLGGSQIEEAAYSVQETTDGGFIIAGVSSSNDANVSGNHIYNGYTTSDYWIVKLDMDGNLLWQRSFGGSGADQALSIQQTTDGGFIVAGYSDSNDGDVTGNHGDGDFWIVKLDTGGNLIWQKAMGGISGEAALSIEQTKDGGFIVAGNCEFSDGDVSGNHGYKDYWIVKIDLIGNIEWQKCLGGSLNDYGYSVQQISDGGFIVAGYIYSGDGNISGNHGGFDYWIVKLDTVGIIVWQKCLGGSKSDFGHSVQQTTDGGFIVAGFSYSNDDDVSGNHGSEDYWIVKLSSDTLTGIVPSQGNSISVSPNPVQTQLIVNLATPTNEVTIRVFDLQGKIRQTALSGQTDKILLNVENLPAGFYTLQIIHDNTGEIEVGKFLKQL